MNVMPKLKKPVVRETGIQINGVPLVIELHPDAVYMRIKRSRTSLKVGWARLYMMAQKEAAEVDSNIEKGIPNR